MKDEMSRCCRSDKERGFHFTSPGSGGNIAYLYYHTFLHNYLKSYWSGDFQVPRKDSGERIL